MKNLIAALCAVVIVVQSGGAGAKTMHAGVKGGLNIADLTGDDADGLDARNGFTGGVFYGIDFTDDFSARIEGLYVMKGAEGPFVSPGDDHEHDSVIKLAYIEFPVLFIVRIPADEKVAISLFAGPTFGFNTRAEIEVVEHGVTEDISDSVKSFEFGAAIGGGVEYTLSSMSVFAEGRYTAGATNVVDVEPSNVKTRGIGIMAGVSFPWGAN